MPSTTFSAQEFIDLRFGNRTKTMKNINQQIKLLVFDHPRKDHIPLLGASVNKWLTFLKTLSVDSVNGSVSLATIAPDTKVILKTAKAKTTTVDPLDYEFIILAVLNTLRPKIPHFVYGLALFSCPSEIQREQISSLCSGGPLREFLVIESAIPGTEFGEYLEQKQANDVTILCHFLQVFMALQYAQDAFNFIHGDFHPGNLLVNSLRQCCPENEAIIQYKYQGKLYEVPAEFLCVIIDFGRSYVKLEDRKQAAERYGLSAKSYNPTGFFRRLQGTKGVDFRSPNFVQDLLRIYAVVYIEANSRFQNLPLIKKYYDLLIQEFPDFPGRYYTNYKQGRQIKRPLDLVKLILAEPKVHAHIARKKKHVKRKLRFG